MTKREVLHPDIHYPAKAQKEALKEKEIAQRAREKQRAETQRVLRLWLQKDNEGALKRLAQLLEENVPDLDKVLKEIQK